MVFPAPFGPMTATNSPDRTENVASVHTGSERYPTCTWSAEIAGPRSLRTPVAWGNASVTVGYCPSAFALRSFCSWRYSDSIQVWNVTPGGWIVSVTPRIVTLLAAATDFIVVVIGVTVC